MTDTFFDTSVLIAGTLLSWLREAAAWGLAAEEGG